MSGKPGIGMSELTIEIKGIEERIKNMQDAMTSNPEMNKRITDVIRTTLSKVRKAMQDDARQGLDMKSDPRNAYKAVRMAVYRRIFGGNINIISSRVAGSCRFYAPPRKLDSNPHQRGGNRRKRTDRTTEMMSYEGKDRGMILRWLNDGTYESPERQTRYGDRGGITARKWFGQRSQQELENAARVIDNMIDDVINGYTF